MTIHPEIAKILATLPAPDGSPLDPAAMRAGEAAQVPALEDRLPLHCVEDATAVTPSGEVPVRIYTPVEADALRAAGVLPRRRVLPRQPGHARPRRAGPGQGDRSQGHLRRLPPGARGRLPGRPRRLLRRWSAGPPSRVRAWAGTARTSPSPATVRAATSSLPSPRWPTTTGSTGSRTRSCSTRRWTWTSTSTATPRCGRTPTATAWRRRACKPFNSFYLESGADPADPLVSPIKREDLTGLPPALIITAEHDPLRDEGELYGQRLQEAGVDATVSRYAGANHGFVQNFSWIPEFYRAFEETGDFLNAGAGQ